MFLLQHPYIYFTLLGIFAATGALLAKIQRKNKIIWAGIFMIAPLVALVFFLPRKKETSSKKRIACNEAQDWEKVEEIEENALGL